MCICTLFQNDPQKDHWERYLNNAIHFVSPRFPFFSQKSLLFQTPHSYFVMYILIHFGQWALFSHFYCCCFSLTKSYPTSCEPMDCSTPGFPVLHCFLDSCSNSCTLSRWCHTTMSCSVITFSSCPQSFPE